jgi:oligopeptide/dipeptide ABC transporter ATP-binding protein
MNAAVIDDLTIRLPAREGDLTLVEHVSMTIRAGTVFGVVGETGAGKTLTMRALLGLLPGNMSVEGRLELAGRDVSGPGAHRAATDGGIVFQNPAGMFDPLCRIGDQLVEAVVYQRRMGRPEALSRALELLGQMGFPSPSDIVRLYPHQLSGGMAQRAAIAMAMMPQPRLMAVDEPTSALDASLRVEILALLRDVAKAEGSAVMIVSHDLNLIGRFCDEIAVMYAGRVVEAGPTAAVLHQPEHPYTRALMATAPSTTSPARTPLPTISGASLTPGSWPVGCVFQDRCGDTFDRCRVTRPLLAKGRSHAAACHLAPQEQ